MITYSKIGKKGNLGNQLFQIASTIGLAVNNKQAYGFFKWKFQDYFKNTLPLINNLEVPRILLEEKYYNYYKWHFEDVDYDIDGWLQTEKYFDKNLTKHYFQFSDEILNSVKNKCFKALNKKTILISIRRGDFVNHPDYFQLSIAYYLNSLVRFFPDWESRNLVVLSDDIHYCKFHFSFLDNVFFGEGLNTIEQLCLGTLCDDFIISNSTFSWWTAWLGEKIGSKIIRPFKNFDGLKSKELNDKDYFPERWISFNHLETKIALNNVIFDINTDKNNELIKNYICNYFDVKINFGANKEGENNLNYTFNKAYIMPPMLIYSTYIRGLENKHRFIINNVTAVFKVNKRLNYLEFLKQNDFGLFSGIFYFSNKKESIKYDDVYLINKSVTEWKIKSNLIGNNLVFNCTAGKFNEIFGYRFSFNRMFKIRMNKIKKLIKKILAIKK